MHLAIITGASAGIGAATAERFARAGHSVCGLARRRCPAAGVEHVACDLSSERSLDSALAALAPRAEAAASLALVHNACPMRKDTARDCDSGGLGAMLQTAVLAANRLNRALLPRMGEGCSVLYVGSTLSERAAGGSFSYVIAKHAVLGMMRATCQDLMGSGIHTACICPGFTDTDMLREHIGDDSGALAQAAAGNSYRRLVSPAEIAELIYWAHRHPVINGAVLHANLGQRQS